jgi:hypothetical protein
MFYGFVDIRLNIVITNKVSYAFSVYVQIDLMH